MLSDQSLTEEVLSKEVVYNGVVIRLEHWQVRLPNGETGLREIACHIGAAAVVPIDSDGRIILVRQHRVAIDKLTLEIPAGKLNYADEDPLECAQRELSEETGYTADSWRELTCLRTTPGFCNERIYMYLAEGLHTGETHPDDDEFISTVCIPLDEAVNMVMRGELNDSKTITGILMAANILSRR